MQLPISEEEIRELVKNKQINGNFKYIDDPDIMYIAISYDPKLLLLISNSLKERLAWKFINDKNLDEDSKLEIFSILLNSIENIPHGYANLIKDEATYLNLANNLSSYLRLCDIPHKFKAKEKELFYQKYESSYLYDPENPVKYAESSPVVLLNFLKRSEMAIFYLSYFNEKAMSDEVVSYIEQNNLISSLSRELYNKFPMLLFLKLKSDISFIFEIDSKRIDDKMIDYLKTNSFGYQDIEKYLKKHSRKPECLKSPKLILYLVKENIEAIKYFEGNVLEDELAFVLVKNNYIYKKGHNKILLTNDAIYQNFLLNGDISILFQEGIKLEEEKINLLIEHIQKNNLPYVDIRNKYLLQNELFSNFIIHYYQIENPYHLENQYLITSLGKSLDKLSKIFSKDAIQIIIREIIKNNYFIDIDGILKHISLDKFSYLYEKLSKKENKFNSKFDFYYFIKITDYLSCNQTLVEELNNHSIDEVILNNLALAINRFDLVDYNTIKIYETYLKDKILNDEKEPYKAAKLLLNYDPSSSMDYLFDIPSLTYLQLNYEKDSLEYILLESYMNLISILKRNNLSEQELKNIHLNPLFDIKVMKQNILRLYARMYKNLSFNLEKFQKENKVLVYGDTKIIDITGSDFSFFVHNPEFNDQYDFTESYANNEREKRDYNYLCTTFASELFPYGLNPKMWIYDFKDENSLIAFGNFDVHIHPTKAPLFESVDGFVNPIDMVFKNHGNHYVPNEFDFLRYDNKHTPLTPNYKIVNNLEDALGSKDFKYVLFFDGARHEEVMKSRFETMCLNIESLNWKDLYKLIGLTTRYLVEKELILKIMDRVKELSEKEQIVLNDALEKYNLKSKIEDKNY